MTLVVACDFKEGAVMVSDSRASLEYQNTLKPEDTLQKIVGIGPHKILGYAGSVKAANLIIEELRISIARKKKLRLLNNVVAKIPGLAKNTYLNKCTKADREGGLQLILTGKNLDNNIEIWSFTAPDFVPIKTDNGFAIIGSGSVAGDYLGKEISTIQKLPTIKDQANALLTGLSSEIAKKENELGGTVGGMLQVIIVTPAGAQPLNYGFVDLNPEGPSEAKYMKMENGEWTQYDYVNDTRYPVLEPNKLLSLPFNETRVHDFKLPDGILRKPKWYLNYFLSCLGLKIEPGNIEFHHIIAEAGSPVFPYEIDLLLAVGFWGTAIKDNMEIFFETEEGKSKIGEIEIERKYLPEDTDISIKLHLKIKKPGITFIEVYFGGQRLGRRAIYFGLVDEKRSLEDIKLSLRTGLSGSKDPELDNIPFELVYFSLAESSSQDPDKLTFNNEVMAVYWKAYPLNYLTFVTSAYRLKAGRHKIRLEAENASTREKIEITKAEIESKSPTITYPLIGQVLISIPKPGFYFINQYVDDLLSHTSIFVAETDSPQFSYTPSDEGIEQVKNGELLSLVKRAIGTPKEFI